MSCGFLHCFEGGGTQVACAYHYRLALHERDELKARAEKAEAERAKDIEELTWLRHRYIEGEFCQACIDSRDAAERDLAEARGVLKKCADALEMDDANNCAHENYCYVECVAAVQETRAEAAQDARAFLARTEPKPAYHFERCSKHPGAIHNEGSLACQEETELAKLNRTESKP